MLDPKQKIGPVSMEEALKDPQYQEYHEAARFVLDKKAKGEILFPNKHLASLKLNCATELRQLRRNDPGIDFNDALIDIFKTIPKKTPVEMYAPLTKHLIGIWKKLDEKREDIGLPSEALTAA